MAVKGQMSHKSTQTRKTDTRARYAFNTKVVRLDPPEALMRVMDALTEAAAKPVRLGTSTLDSDESRFGSTSLALPAARTVTDAS